MATSRVPPGYCVDPVLEIEAGLLADAEDAITETADRIEFHARALRDCMARHYPRDRTALSELHTVLVLLEDELRAGHVKLETANFCLKKRSAKLTKKIVKLKNERAAYLKAACWLAKDAMRHQDIEIGGAAVCEYMQPYLGEDIDLDVKRMKKKKRANYHAAGPKVASRTSGK